LGVTHREGGEEGGVFAKFLGTKGTDVDLGRLLADEETAAKRELLGSPELRQEIERSLLQLLDDPALKVEYETQGDSIVREWPALVRKYTGVPAADLLARLRARAEGLKPALRIEVSKPVPSDTVYYDVEAFVVMKKGKFIFEVRQLLHFYYRDKVLQRVNWGLKFTRTLKLKPKGG